MSDAYTYLLGEGGWSSIHCYSISAGSDSAQDIGNAIIPYVSASVDRTMNIPMAETANIPWSDDPRSSIRLGKGTYVFQGNISFELTNKLKEYIFNIHKDGSYDGVFFYRNSLFDLVLCDTSKIVLNGCSWTNFSMSCKANSLITCDMSFLSLNMKNNMVEREDIELASWSSPEEFSVDNEHTLEEYWQYGVDDISLTDFSISLSRNVEPIFLNNELCVPTYLRVGSLKTSINLSCTSDWFSNQTNASPTSFSLGGGYYFELLNDYQQSKNYTFHGFNEVGTKAYTIEGSNNSTKEVFQVVKK